MRLLNTHTLQLENFGGDESDIPLYAILSHTWGNDEITFQDITQKPLESLRNSEAFFKVQECCSQARKNGYNYVWIDTCCIDKTSSAELSEAINSMFKWYQQASVCYVLLSDFDITLSYGFFDTPTGRVVSIEYSDTSFLSSRWFTRGWTLQELIAPRCVNFFDKSWVKFGSRDGHLLDRICQKTGIWPEVFDEPRCSCPRAYPCPPVRHGICEQCLRLDTLPQTLESFAVSVKMSWASSRITTRKEDSAYCLLGLFNLNMPMLYGEGAKAFLRLQEAIIRQSKDQSILLWHGGPNLAPRGRTPGCLALSSSLFQNPTNILGRRVFERFDRIWEFDFMSSISSMELTDTTIQMKLWICPCRVRIYSQTDRDWLPLKLFLGIMDLAYDDDYLIRPALLLERLGTRHLYRRVYHSFVIPVDPRVIYESQVPVKQALSAAPTAPELENTGLFPILIKVSRDLNEATPKNIGILLHESAQNALSLNLSYDLGPKTGPVYLLAKKRRMRNTATSMLAFKYTLSSSGSYPPVSSYDARTTQIPAPWVFEKCQHFRADRYVGGIHFVTFSINDTSTGNHHQSIAIPHIRVAIVWGMHRGVNAENIGHKSYRPWCRVFNMPAFIEHAHTSENDWELFGLHHEGRALKAWEIQSRLEGQRRRLCQPNYQYLYIPQESEQKSLFPSSCEDGWEEDQMNGIANDPVMDTHLAVKLVVTEGLGRRLYEVQFDIDQTPKTPKPSDDQ
ncbi:hypothetical protein ACLX1H_005864 [Fusarium chlamydosporum]